VQPHPAADTAPPWALPVQVVGPVEFLAVGLWPVQLSGRPGDVGQIARTLDWLDQHHDNQPVVLAGDFNAPISTTLVAYQRLQSRFAALGLTDAFQHARPGQRDASPTLYMHRRQHEPFHIDHILIPQGWTRGLSVTVGDYDTWVGSGRSDHTPLTADLPVADAEWTSAASSVRL
jgi:endonuclease/exonuclease/phosphatase family metal-dependent hydrolase